MKAGTCPPPSSCQKHMPPHSVHLGPVCLGPVHLGPVHLGTVWGPVHPGQSIWGQVIWVQTGGQSVWASPKVQPHSGPGGLNGAARSRSSENSSPYTVSRRRLSISWGHADHGLADAGWTEPADMPTLKDAEASWSLDAWGRREDLGPACLRTEGSGMRSPCCPRPQGCAACCVAPHRA